MIALADLQAWLKVSGDDALLTSLETRAVAFLERQTDRHFGAATEFVEVLDGGGEALWLREAAEAAPALLLEEWDGTAWATVPAADYEVDGRRIYRASRYDWTRGRRRYRATYTAGYAAGEEPGDIRQLVLDLVALKYRSRGQEARRSEAIGGYSYSVADLEALPGARATIESWRRGVYA